MLEITAFNGCDSFPNANDECPKPNRQRTPPTRTMCVRDLRNRSISHHVSSRAEHGGLQHRVAHTYCVQFGVATRRQHYTLFSNYRVHTAEHISDNCETTALTTHAHINLEQHSNAPAACVYLFVISPSPPGLSSPCHAHCQRAFCVAHTCAHVIRSQRHHHFMKCSLLERVQISLVAYCNNCRVQVARLRLPLVHARTFADT